MDWVDLKLPCTHQTVDGIVNYPTPIPILFSSLCLKVNQVAINFDPWLSQIHASILEIVLKIDSRKW